MTETPTAPAERGSNFFWGFLALPRAKRDALSAVYAYCRLIDDIVDEGLPKEEARRQLDFWAEEIERLFKGEPAHPVARALLPHVKAFALPKAAFHEMIRGCRMDLEGVSYRTIGDLESYMHGVASSVGELSLAIFGPKHTPPQAAREFARSFGCAFQLTNIIRDVGADLELGRVYLPEEDIEAAGYSLAELRTRSSAPAFERLMSAQYERAKAYYRRGRSLVDPRDRPALLAAEVMAHVYEGLLDSLKREGFPVLFGKHRLPGWRKATLAARAWFYCHGLA